MTTEEHLPRHRALLEGSKLISNFTPGKSLTMVYTNLHDHMVFQHLKLHLISDYLRSLACLSCSTVLAGQHRVS
jgi:hypothetical protein